MQPITILFLTANPLGTEHLRIDAELRLIKDLSRKSIYGRNYKIVQEEAVRVSDIQEHILRNQPSIVHFSGHGGGSQLIFEDEQGNPYYVNPDALARLFASFKKFVRLVFLNACYSEEQGRAIAEHVDCVIGMSFSILDQAAGKFSPYFYQALGYGQSVASAFELGLAELDLETIGDEDVPVLISQKVDVGQMYFVPQEREVKEGAVPRVNIPFQPNPDFVGRDEDLKQIHELLQNGGNTIILHPTALTGMGGIGKTQLAVEYAYSYQREYSDGIFWINAANPIKEEISAFAEALKLASRETPLDQAIRLFWSYLEQHPQVLLIFDSLAEPNLLNSPLIPELIPAALPGYKLVTTRHRDLPRGFQAFDVKVLPETAALQLLLRARQAALQPDHPDHRRAHQIAASLGWLPLALELSAAYLQENPEVTLSGYLHRLKNEGGLVVLDSAEVKAVDLPTRHDKAVKASLLLQWKSLQDESARHIFLAAGQFPEAAWIPNARLAILSDIPDKASPGYPSLLRQSLRRLNDISLVEELSNDRLRLHPLVHEFARSLAIPSLREEMVISLYEAYQDMMRLDGEIKQRGVDEVQEDLRTGLRFYADSDVSRPEIQYLRALKRVIDREAHYLRSWHLEQQPGFVLQQLRNQSLIMGLDELCIKLENQLEWMGWAYLRERFPVRCESTSLLRSLTGHTNHVSGVALSSDGARAVSASNDRTLKVWDVESGRELRTLKGHSQEVTGVAMTPDGRLAISASKDETLIVWDVEHGTALHTLKGHHDWVWGASISADGSSAVSAGGEGILIVWDLETGREKHKLKGHWRDVYSVAMSANGRLAVSASKDTTLKVWDLEQGRELRTLKGHSREVTGVAMTPDGRLAVSVGVDQTINVWDVRTGEALQTIPTNGGWLYCVAVSEDGHLAITASLDSSVILWDLENGTQISKFRGHADTVHSVAIGAGGRLAVTASWDQSLKLWEIESASEADLQIGQGFWVNGVALSAGGEVAVSASADWTMKAWNTQTGKEMRKLEKQSAWVTDVAISADGVTAITGNGSGEISIYNLKSKRKPRILKEIFHDLHSVAMSSDGHIATCGSGQGILPIWKIQNGRKIRTLKAKKNRSYYDVALSADGSLAASVSSERAVVIWDILEGRQLYELGGYPEMVNCVALSANGRLVISGCQEGSIKIWDTENRRELRTLREHSGSVYDIWISPDGTQAVSVSDDDTLRLWDILEGRQRLVLAISNLKCCASTSDGRLLAAGDYRGGIHFIDVVGLNENLP